MSRSANQNQEVKPLITRALELGWIRRSSAPELKIETYLRREHRARWHALGLNSQGRPRRNTPRPALAGLDRKTYHREHMRLCRASSTFNSQPSPLPVTVNLT